MKRLLLSLWLVGAVFPGHTPNLLQTQSHPASVERLVEARAGAPLPALATPEFMPESQPSGVEPVRSLAMTGQDTQSITLPRRDNQRAPLPTTGDSSEPSGPPVAEGDNKEAIWVVVIRWATVHSDPSVSAPTVRFYSVGTELQLIDHQHGWFQVLDPVTSQRGWIYEKYYLQAIRGPGQMIAAVQESSNPKLANARKPTPHVRNVKNLRPRPTKKTQTPARYRYETVASIMERALRR
jgi:hypothetical protein